MRKRTNGMRRGQGGNLWMSFSDLMSSLLLIIILILFYVMYQYFEMAEVNAREIAQQQAELDAASARLVQQQSTLEQQQSTLDEQRVALEQQQAQLQVQQTTLEQQRSTMEQQQSTIETTQSDLNSTRSTLTEREQDLITAQTLLAEKEARIEEQQAQLDAQRATLDAQQATLETQQAQLVTQQTTLETQQAQLATQQTTLEEQQAQLATQQTTLDRQKTQLDAQQSTLETQQAQLDLQQTQLETQQAQMEQQEKQLEQLIGIRPKIIQSLSDALKRSRIAASVDKTTGAITLEADVLFDSGQFVLTDAGKATIDSFLPVYLDVLFSEEYEPYLSQIIIEGHTDSRGDYISNLNLSQQRAGAVASYVLSDSYTSITAAQRRKLREFTTANGRSFSDPVLVNGVEDMDKSRRVVFKFQLVDEQMVTQMQQILSGE